MRAFYVGTDLSGNCTRISSNKINLKLYILQVYEELLAYLSSLQFSVLVFSAMVFLFCFTSFQIVPAVV